MRFQIASEIITLALAPAAVVSAHCISRNNPTRMHLPHLGRVWQFPNGTITVLPHSGTQRATTCGPHATLGHVVTLWCTMWCQLQSLPHWVPQCGTHHIVPTALPHVSKSHVANTVESTTYSTTLRYTRALPHRGTHHIVHHSVIIIN